MIRNLLLAVDIGTSSNVTEIAGDLAAVSGAAVEVLHCDDLDGIFDTPIWLDDDTKPRSAVGRAVYGRSAPTTAAPVGTSSMGRLGRLLKNGTRRVRIT
jgi:hypothetical protein